MADDEGKARMVLSLSEEDKRRLKVRAAESGMTVSEWVASATVQFVPAGGVR